MLQPRWPAVFSWAHLPGPTAAVIRVLTRGWKRYIGPENRFRATGFQNDVSGWAPQAITTGNDPASAGEDRPRQGRRNRGGQDKN